MALYQDSVLASGPLLFISGQIAQQDDSIPESIEEQMDVVLGKIDAIIKHNGVGLSNIVKMSFFITDKEYLPALREKLANYLQGAKPAMTLLIVAGLIDPAYKVEIEAVVSI